MVAAFPRVRVAPDTALAATPVNTAEVAEAHLRSCSTAPWSPLLAAAVAVVEAVSAEQLAVQVAPAVTVKE